MRGGGAIGPGYGRRGTNRGGTDLGRRRLGRYVGPRSPFNFTFFSWALGVKGVSFAGDGQVGGKRSGIRPNGGNELCVGAKAAWNWPGVSNTNSVHN